MAKKKMPEHVAQAVIDRADGHCEYMIFPICQGRPGPIHHRKISGREHSVEGCVHICRACHDWTHQNPAESYRLGFLVKMGHDPGEVPVQYQGRPALLSADGLIHYQPID